MLPEFVIQALNVFTPTGLVLFGCWVAVKLGQFAAPLIKEWATARAAMHRSQSALADTLSVKTNSTQAALEDNGRVLNEIRETVVVRGCHAHSLNPGLPAHGLQSVGVKAS